MKSVEGNRTEFFNSLEAWFLNQRNQIEKDWKDLIERYKNEEHLGKIVYFQMGRSGCSRIENKVSKYLNIPFNWNDSEYDFYFNAIHSDLNTDEYNHLKLQLEKMLGEPDKIDNYYDINEPSWTNGVIKVRLRHVDTHGGGYEKLEIEIDKDYFKDLNNDT